MIYTEKLLSESNPKLKKFKNNVRISMNSVDEFNLAYIAPELYDIESDDVIRNCIVKAIPKIIVIFLTEKEQKVVSMYFYQQKNMKYIAEKMGCSVQNISSIKKNAVKKIKNHLIAFVPDKWHQEELTEGERNYD